ncbi:MAG: NAD(P)H-hydrate dehydratase [Bacteroidia bacterium]
MQDPVKIFSSLQIKKADAYTIIHQPISSIDLMEKAAIKCTEWIAQHIEKKSSVIIFCGPGNNGGDGLAITRLLYLLGFNVKVYVLRFSTKYSQDFIENENRLKHISGTIIHDILSISDFPEIRKKDIVVDSIFGTGLSKGISGLAADCVLAINKSPAKIIAIDVPSGLFANMHSGSGSPIIKADHTLSFQFPKLAFLFPENAGYVGDWQILDIGLSKKFIDEEPTQKFFTTKNFIRSFLKPRAKYSHKGTFGHALIIAGSYGKMGAAVLSAASCLRSGVGLLTMHIPKSGNEIMQITNPEAMTSIDENENIFSDNIDTSAFSSVGIGPGIGTDPVTQKALKHLFSSYNKPLVLDADALNIISKNAEWLRSIPANSIITPHLKEFERLTKKAANDFERHEIQIDFSKKNKLFVVLKGAHTCISCPNGDVYFNATGNPGMAKGGSGDILTGIITGLLAQGYTSLESCLLGVYIHGLAGDLAKKDLGETGMISGDISNYLPQAFIDTQK